MVTAAKIERPRTNQKREYFLEKRDGTEIRCLVPGHFTVGQAKGVLAERAGYEPNIAEDGLSVRLAVRTSAGHALLPDETRFRDLEEGLTLKPIPGLAPARP